MTDTKKLIVSGVVLLVVFFVGIAVFASFSSGVPTLGSGPVFNEISSATHSSSTVAATSTNATIVLAANGARQYAVISNTDANAMYCVYGATSTLATGDMQGILLAASGGTLTIGPDNLYKGIVSCYSDGGTSVAATLTTP